MEVKEITKFREISNKAEVYRKQGNYKGVIDLYKVIWGKENANFDNWDSWRYSSSLRKVGKVKEALEICTEVYKRSPNFVQNVSIFSWCLFDYYINKDKDEINKNENEFLNIAMQITNFTKQDRYSPYERTVFKVIEYLKNKSSFPANNIDEWLNKLNPVLLTNEVYKFVDKDGENREKASPKEKWYSLKSKVLVKQMKYKECIDVGNTALMEIDNFHYDDDMWIKTRIAWSKGRLGLKQEAISELKSLLMIKDNWVIQYDISKLYNEINNLEEALSYAFDAALNCNDFKLQLPLFYDLAIILKDKNKIDMAKKHILLCVKIRNENNWSISKELLDQVNFFGLNENNDSAQLIYKELKKYWIKEKKASMPSVTGKVQKVLSNGKSGFIMGDDNKKYYFKTKSFIGNRGDLIIGLNVIFNVKKSFDIKKGIESDNAVFVEKMKSVDK